MKLLIAVGTALLSALVFAPAGADDVLPGKIVLARASGDAIVIYDATPEVAAFVRTKTADAPANTQLIHDTIRVLTKEAPLLDAAKTVTVRVLYAKSGEVSPAYGNPTFEGVERYANASITAADLKSDAGRWKEAANAAAAPSAIKFTVVGTLPPRP